VGALSKSGSSFVVSDEKSYDAWGGLRTGTNANGKAAYCANIGHKQDDESGLVYMRARYYELTSGRFVSEDEVRDGMNWFSYCRNKPTSLVDSSGNESKSPWAEFQCFTGMTCFYAAFAVASSNPSGKWAMGGVIALIVAGVYCMQAAANGDPGFVFEGTGSGLLGKGALQGTVLAGLVMAIEAIVNYIVFLAKAGIPNLTKANSFLMHASASFFCVRLHFTLLFKYG
jgi:RHS repeat-associated protein